MVRQKNSEPRTPANWQWAPQNHFLFSIHSNYKLLEVAFQFGNRPLVTKHQLLSGICCAHLGTRRERLPPLCNSDSIAPDFISKPFHDFFRSEGLPSSSGKALTVNSHRAAKTGATLILHLFLTSDLRQFLRTWCYMLGFFFLLYSDMSSLS